MRKRIKDFQQRDISYGELSALSDEFETQLDEHGVIFDDEEDRDEAFFDFVQQYIDGNDDPQIDFTMAKVRPVRDSKRRQVRDGRREIDAWRKDFDNFENDYADYKQKVTALVPTLSPDEVDGRYSDLYLKSTPKVDEFINSLRGSYRLGGSRVSRFKSNIDGTPWYEIVFGNLWWNAQGYESETDFSQICKGGSISDSRHIVRDYSKRRVRDARGRGNYEPVKRAIDEFVEEYCSDEPIDDYGIINNGLGSGDGLLALADVGGSSLYVFNSEEDAYDYVVTNGYGADYISGAMPESEWVDYLVNGGVDRDEAERLIETEDWQAITEIIAEKMGEEWFLGSYFGEKFRVNDFVIYY